MTKRMMLVIVVCFGLFSGATVWRADEQAKPDTIFHVNVNMVQLDVAVTDKRGNYITRLSPWDFEIYEDGIPQRVATFGEENEAPRRLEDYPHEGTAVVADPPICHDGLLSVVFGGGRARWKPVQLVGLLTLSPQMASSVRSGSHTDG